MKRLDRQAPLPHERNDRRHRRQPGTAVGDVFEVVVDEVEQCQPVAGGFVADVVDQPGEHVHVEQLAPPLGTQQPARHREVLALGPGRVERADTRIQPFAARWRDVHGRQKVSFRHFLA